MRIYASIFAAVFIASGAVHLWSYHLFPMHSSSLFGDPRVRSTVYVEIDDVTVIVNYSHGMIGTTVQGSPASDVAPVKLHQWNNFSTYPSRARVCFEHHRNAFAHLGSKHVGSNAIVVGFPFRAVWIENNLGIRYSNGVGVVDALPLTLNMLIWSMGAVAAYAISAASFRHVMKIGRRGRSGSCAP
jgi:hypothetical protein